MGILIAPAGEHREQTGREIPDTTSISCRGLRPQTQSVLLASCWTMLF